MDSIAKKKPREEYDRLFEKNPPAANTWLLLQELANQKGQVHTNEKQLAKLLGIRFPDGLDKYSFGDPENE